MNGLRFLMITYPGYIALPIKRPLVFSFTGKLVIFCVHEHIDALTVTDFHNSLDEPSSGKPQVSKPISIHGETLFVKYNLGSVRRQFAYEYTHGSEKFVSSRFYTKFSVSYEIDNPAKPSAQEEEFGDALIEEFIDSYKFVADDARVFTPKEVLSDRLIVQEALAAYDSGDHALSPTERLQRTRSLNLGVKKMTAMQPTESIPPDYLRIIHNQLKLEKFLKKAEPLRDEFRLLNKAIDELERNRNYKYALLESFLAAESSVSRALYKLKLSRGVSKSKLEEYKKDMKISYQLNVELPFMMDSITTRERGIIGRVDGIRKIRNDVVHEGKSVSEKEARSAIDSVYLLLKMLIRRKLI